MIQTKTTVDFYQLLSVLPFLLGLLVERVDVLRNLKGREGRS